MKLLKLVVFWTTAAVLLFIPVISIHLDADGGYSGIVIKVSHQVPEDQCDEILDKIQVMFNDASRVLFNAMDEKVFFREVTVVVPRHWRDSRCQFQIQTPRGALVYRDTHIHVGLEHPVHRKSPFTQQSRGCGKPGDFVAFPYTFFTNWNLTQSIFGSPGKLFVHEWSKLRYGIFDEFGFSGDKLYPNYYEINGQLHPTGSSDKKIVGQWLLNESECDPRTTADCQFVASLTGNDEATCSLGYMPFLPNVARYCGLNEQYNLNEALPPTKHNVLCSAQSAKDVINNHVDIKDRPLAQAANLNITLRVVKEPVTKYVLVLESSSSMIKQDLWKWISKAAQKFIRNDLPDQTKMAIVTFSNDSIIQHNLAPLVDENARARIADSIPDKYKVQRSPDMDCVRCGLETAVKQVLNGEEAGSHIILVTRGMTSLDLNEQETIEELASYYQLRFSSLIIGKNPTNNFYDKLSAKTLGRSFVYKLPENSKDNVGAGIYYQMIESFYALRRLDLDSAFVPVSVHSNVVTREAPGLKSKGTFSIDSTLGQDTLFGIIVDEPDDHNIKSVTFTDNGGTTYGPYSSLSNEYIIFNMKTINFPKGSPAPPFDDPAHLGLQWKYEVQWYDEGNRQLENVIVVESKPRSLGSFGLIDIKMWTSNPSEVTTDAITSHTPLKLYASVSRGSSPVLDAKVKVQVHVLAVNGSLIQLDDIYLLDNGNGNPDLVQGDGIYSRYLTQYPTQGRYSFSAYVDDNESKAYTIQVGRNGRAMPQRPQDPASHPVCCGSEIDVPKDLRRSTGTFKRILNEGPVHHLITVPDVSDTMPPARIADLRLEADKGGRKLIAMWTAPGDNYDTGMVSKYNFVFSEDIVDLLDSSRSPPILHEVSSKSDQAGTEAMYSFTFNNYDKDYHVAMFAIDGQGNKGKLSNIVLVRLPQPPSTEDPNNPTTPNPNDPNETDWVMVGVVSGVVITLVILLLVGLYLYFFMSKKRRSGSSKSNGLKSSGVNVDLPVNGSDNSSFDDTKNSSSNHLVPQISTISNAYKAMNGNNGQVPSSTSFANGITPTYWSASQLLKEHEERKLRESKMMGSIAEENQGYDYNSDLNYAPYYNHQDYVTDHYNHQMMYHYGQRLSTAESNYQSGAVDYHPNAEPAFGDPNELLRNNNKTSTTTSALPKTSGNSDNSSSGTLGLANNSLQGSLISVNSGRPPSSAAKTRNITQV